MANWTQNILLTNPNLQTMINNEDKLLVMGDLEKIQMNFCNLKQENYDSSKNDISSIFFDKSNNSISKPPILINKRKKKNSKSFICFQNISGEKMGKNLYFFIFF